MIQWLGFRTFTADILDSVTGQGTKILQAMWHGQKQSNLRNLSLNLTKSCVSIDLILKLNL